MLLNSNGLDCALAWLCIRLLELGLAGANLGNKSVTAIANDWRTQQARGASTIRTLRSERCSHRSQRTISGTHDRSLGDRTACALRASDAGSVAVQIRSVESQLSMCALGLLIGDATSMSSSDGQQMVEKALSRPGDGALGAAGTACSGTAL